jgi:DNA-binding transcriptional regulator YiaG
MEQAMETTMRGTAAPGRKRVRWTPRLIRQLRGKRTLTEFGELLGAPKNTVWRWEAARTKPDSGHSARLSELAERERFLDGWKLVGSVTLLDNLESAQSEIAALFRKSLERTSRDMGG